jgi:glutamate-1-semialdehyde 2,1-aminomutase
MGTLFFHRGPVRDFDSALQSDTRAYARFFHGMLDRGFYFAPAQFEAAFVSLAHTPEQISAACAAAREVLSGNP